jgi:SAM-dependent methyltransferase
MIETLGDSTARGLLGNRRNRNGVNYFTYPRVSPPELKMTRAIPLPNAEIPGDVLSYIRSMYSHLRSQGKSTVQIIDIGFGAEGDTNAPTRRISAEVENRAIGTRKMAKAFSDLSRVEIVGIYPNLREVETAVLVGHEGRPPFLQENLRYVVANPTSSLGVIPGSIDFAVCLDLLEGLAPEAQQALVKNVYEALNGNGVFFFRPSAFAPIRRLDRYPNETQMPDSWINFSTANLFVRNR